MKELGSELRGKMKELGSELRGEMKELENRLIVKMGIIMATIMTIGISI